MMGAAHFSRWREAPSFEGPKAIDPLAEVELGSVGPSWIQSF